MSLLELSDDRHLWQAAELSSRYVDVINRSGLTSIIQDGGSENRIDDLDKRHNDGFKLI
jgi:hypothetical protein